MKIGFVIILVALHLCFVVGEQCTTPDGGPGKCIILIKCESILALMRKLGSPQRTTEDISRMEKSQCGFEGRTPKVCCPEETVVVPPTTETNFNVDQDNFCFTPDAQEGKCISLFNCQHIVSMLSQPNDEIRAFVRNSKCDGPDAPSVCCGHQPPNLRPRRGRCASTVAPQYSGSRCCGVEASTPDRIFGGEDAEVDEYPWMALIEYSTTDRIKLMCGGSLISGRYVLTAGHCVAGPILDAGTPRNVRLGEYDTRNNPGDIDCKSVPGGDEDCTTGAVVIPIEKIIPHEQYDPYHQQNRNDIALLRLKEMAPYTDFIRPICLPQTDITTSGLPNINFAVAGWGYVNWTHTSPIKQFVHVPYLSIDVCQLPYRVPRRRVELWSGQICAGGEAKKDACKGDSGGPLIYKPALTSELVGVVSFGVFPCGVEGVPGVYTKVYEYLPWIRRNIKP